MCLMLVGLMFRLLLWIDIYRWFLCVCMCSVICGCFCWVLCIVWVVLFSRLINMLMMVGLLFSMCVFCGILIDMLMFLSLQLVSCSVEWMVFFSRKGCWLFLLGFWQVKVLRLEMMFWMCCMFLWVFFRFFLSMVLVVMVGMVSFMLIVIRLQFIGLLSLCSRLVERVLMVVIFLCCSSWFLSLVKV